jgi:hypothetical protein
MQLSGRELALHALWAQITSIIKPNKTTPPTPPKKCRSLKEKSSSMKKTILEK